MRGVATASATHTAARPAGRASRSYRAASGRVFPYAWLRCWWGSGCCVDASSQRRRPGCHHRHRRCRLRLLRRYAPGCAPPAQAHGRPPPFLPYLRGCGRPAQVPASPWTPSLLGFAMSPSRVWTSCHASQDVERAVPPPGPLRSPRRPPSVRTWPGAQSSAADHHSEGGGCHDGKGVGPNSARVGVLAAAAPEVAARLAWSHGKW